MKLSQRGKGFLFLSLAHVLIVVPPFILYSIYLLSNAVGLVPMLWALEPVDMVTFVIVLLTWLVIITFTTIIDVQLLKKQIKLEDIVTWRGRKSGS